MNANTDYIKKRIIYSNNTIIQTMKLMDVRCLKSFLVFEKDSFIGMVTIGDLQRAIISNKPFDTPIGSIIDNTKKKYAHVDDDQEHIRAWMLEVRAEMMPIVDSNNHLREVIFWDDLFKEPHHCNRSAINLPVVIMAGGKGTRLKPITNVLPKPLIPIGEKTILEEIMNQFDGIGCEEQEPFAEQLEIDLFKSGSDAIRPVELCLQLFV